MSTIHPQGLPGGDFIDWRYVVDRMNEGNAHASLELLGSEGEKRQFGGRLPTEFIGLVLGGLLLGEDPEVSDVIVLDTLNGVVHWMTCPTKISDIAQLKPRDLACSRDGEEDHNEASDGEDCESKDEDEEEEHSSDQTNDEEEEEDDDEDENEGVQEDDSDVEDIQWGPGWPVRDFFEMLKNQFRELDFMAKDACEVVNLWINTTAIDGPLPEEFVPTLQSIYRRHG